MLLISFDTLRADVAYNGTFPAIEMLRARGVAFSTVVSSSPITPVSHATVLTGMQPPGHGIRHLLREKLATGVPTLATALEEAGYETMAVVACPGMSSWYGLDRGFMRYDDWIPLLSDGRNAVDVVDVELRGTALKRADEVSRRARDMFASRCREKPWFLFVHYFDAHWPYGPPEVIGGPRANGYEDEVGYMDHHLLRLVTEIERLGFDWSDTLVILFSDHGEDLAGWYPNDHAVNGMHTQEKGHGTLLYDITQLVPLIVCDPDGGSATAVDSQVRLADVFPSVLELLGLPARPADGDSFAPAVRGEGIEDRLAYGEALYREELAQMEPDTWGHLGALYSVRHPHFKLIWEPSANRVAHLDLLSDPDERQEWDLAGRTSSLPSAAIGLRGDCNG